MGALAREVPECTMHGAHRVENNGSRGGEDRSQKVPVSLDLGEPSEVSRQAGWGAYGRLIGTPYRPS